MLKLISAVMATLLLAALLFFCFVVAVHWGERNLPLPPSRIGLLPVPLEKDLFGWKQQKHDEFMLDASAAWTVGPIPASKAERVKIAVQSTAPVNIAFVLGDLVNGEVGKVNFNASYSHAPNPATCVRMNSLSTELECSIPADGYFRFLVVQDARVTGAMPGLLAAGAAYLGAKGPLSDLLARNTVRFTGYHWECVQHCEK